MQRKEIRGHGWSISWDLLDMVTVTVVERHWSNNTTCFLLIYLERESLKSIRFHNHCEQK